MRDERIRFNPGALRNNLLILNYGFGIVKTKERIIRQGLIYKIETLFDNYQTFNGKRSIKFETMISIIIKEKGRDVWAEWLIEQPDVLIKDPFYDCEYATNREIQTILSIDLIKAREWIANNFKLYKQVVNNDGLKLFIPWLEQ